MSELIKKQLSQMDHTSEEFFEIYSLVNDKYWSFEKPDNYQSAALALNALLHKGEEWLVELTVKVAMQLFEIVDNNTPAVVGSFGVKGKEVHFTFSTEKSALANLEKQLRNTVMVKSKEANQ